MIANALADELADDLMTVYVLEVRRCSLRRFGRMDLFAPYIRG